MVDGAGRAVDGARPFSDGDWGCRRPSTIGVVGVAACAAGVVWCAECDDAVDGAAPGVAVGEQREPRSVCRSGDRVCSDATRRCTGNGVSRFLKFQRACAVWSAAFGSASQESVDESDVGHAWIVMLAGGRAFANKSYSM